MAQSSSDLNLNGRWNADPNFSETAVKSLGSPILATKLLQETYIGKISSFLWQKANFFLMKPCQTKTNCSSYSRKERVMFKC